MNPFLRRSAHHERTPIRAEKPTTKTPDRGVVTLRLYEPIDSWGGEWGISAKEFVSVLDSLPDDTAEIRLLINSPGGHAWEGLAILNALRAHKAKFVAVVEGIAASAASFIAAGADELDVMPNCEIMIHRAWGGCLGNAEDMHKTGDDLTHLDRNMASVYAGKTGGDPAEWLERMSAETFYSAEEAVEIGLADRVVKPAKGGEDAVDKAKARFDLSVFARWGRPDDAPSTGPAPETTSAAESTQVSRPPADPAVPDGEATSPPAAEPEPSTTEEDPVSDLTTGVRQRLGLPDDADDATVLAALDDKLTTPDPEPTPVPDPQPEPDRDAEPRPDPTPTPAPPAPQQDPALAQMKAEIARLSAEVAAGKAKEAAAAKARVLDAAEATGKIAPAERPAWEARYDKSPDVTTEILDSMAAGTAVPVAAVGHTGPAEPDGDTDWDRFERELYGPQDATTSSKGA